MHGRAPHGRVSLGLVRSRALRSVGRAGAQAAPVHGGPLPDGAAGGGGGAAGGVAATARTTWKTRRSAAGGLSELSRPARRRGVLGRLSRRGDGDGRGLGWPDGSAMYHSIYSVLLFLCSRAMMGWDALRYTRPGGWDAGCATLSLGDSDRLDWGPSRHSLGWSGMRYATPTGVVWDAGCATLTLDDSDRGGGSAMRGYGMARGGLHIYPTAVHASVGPGVLPCPGLLLNLPSLVPPLPGFSPVTRNFLKSFEARGRTHF